MSYMRWIPVHWMCRSCGAEGVYTTWNPDAADETIHKIVAKKVLEECPMCTDAQPGPPFPTEPGNNLETVLVTILNKLEEHEKRLTKIEES